MPAHSPRVPVSVEAERVQRRGIFPDDQDSPPLRVEATQDPLYQAIVAHLPAGARASDYITSLEIVARKPAPPGINVGRLVHGATSRGADDEPHP